MFPNSKHFKCNYTMDTPETEVEGTRTRLLVKVHGRFPISAGETTLLGRLLSLMAELALPTLATGRRMSDLVEPYNVLVRGPGKKTRALWSRARVDVFSGDGALSTVMVLGDYWYFTSVMLALENEACQLLGHVARDNRKRKRDGNKIVRLRNPIPPDNALTP